MSETSSPEGKNETDSGLELRMQGLAPVGETLPSGFAYLIRSSLRMSELYPLLGEILFGGRADEFRDHKENWDTGTNCIVFSIDDDRNNLLGILATPEQRKIAELSESKDILYPFYSTALASGGKGGAYQVPRFSAWMDTYGEFGDEHTRSVDPVEWEASKSNSLTFLTQSIVGAGNPMSMFRFFRVVGAKDIPNEDNTQAKKRLNVYLLSSLSSLYRNIGLQETAALLKVMLEDIWRKKTGKEKKIEGQDGLFFAVIQDGVMEDREASYLESFFDGIFHLSPATLGPYRIPKLRVESLPNHPELPPTTMYLPDWQYESFVETPPFRERIDGTSVEEACFVRTFRMRENIANGSNENQTD